MDFEHATDACICASARSSDSAAMDRLWNVAFRYFLDVARDVVRSYVTFIPGLSLYINVDTIFDSLDQVAADHADEAREIIQGAYGEIQRILDESKRKSGNLEDVRPDVKVKLLIVFRKRTAELYELGKKVGGNAVHEVLEKNMQAMKDLGSGYEQLKTLMGSGGAEVKKALDKASTQNKVRPTFCIRPFYYFEGV